MKREDPFNSILMTNAIESAATIKFDRLFSKMYKKDRIRRSSINPS